MNSDRCMYVAGLGEGLARSGDGLTVTVVSRTSLCSMAALESYLQEP